MENRLGRAHGEHEIGVEERPVGADRHVARHLEVDELRILGVVDHDLAVKAPREAGGDDAEAFELAAMRPPREPGGDEQRLPLGGDACALELDRGRGECRLSRVVQGAGDRQRRRLDHDRRPAAAGDERLERIAREREPERVADRRAHVGDLLARRRRPQHDRIVGSVHDHDPGPEKQWQLRH